MRRVNDVAQTHADSASAREILCLAVHDYTPDLTPQNNDQLVEIPLKDQDQVIVRGEIFFISQFI